MKKICSTLVVFFALIGFVAAQGIEFFHGTWVEALAEAKKQEKPIFVDAYTTWCGPCQMMSKNVFTHADVGAFFNENFILFSPLTENGMVPFFASKWSIS